MKSLKQCHTQVLIKGLEQNILLATKLVNMYAMFNSMANARQVFDSICKRNVFLWNAMIRGYAWNGPWVETLMLYCEMQRADIEPNKFTYPFLLKACTALLALQEGKQIHSQIIRSGLESDVYVSTALVDLYAKCGSLEDARQKFHGMSQRNSVSWNAMIAGYAQNGCDYEALQLFRHMQLEDMKLNEATILSTITICAGLGILKQGKEIHGYVLRNGFDSDVFVGTTLIEMYAKCRGIENAGRVFDKMSRRDVVSWNTMIAGYVENGFANEAFRLFRKMIS